MAKSDEKQTYLMRKTWHTTLKKLTDEQIGSIMRSIMCFQDGEENEVDNPILDAIAQGYIAELQRDKDSYDETCAKRAEAGAKGGEAKAAKKNVANVANAKSATEKEANLADKDKDKDKDRDKDSNNIFPADMPEALQEATQTWLDYKKERREGYKPVSLATLIKKIMREASEHGEEAVIRAIEYSISNRYQGIIWDKVKGSSPPKKIYHNHEGRKYDFEALEREATGSG